MLNLSLRLHRIVISILAGAALGALVGALSPVGDFWPGMLAAAAISSISFFCLICGWKWAGGGRTLFWMITLALTLRLVIGIGAGLLLPEFGFDEPTQNAGYLFNDAFMRDVEAFDITRSNVPLWQIFSMEFDNDQYGGLLVLAGLIYKLFSPDAHRAFLIVLLSAFTAALGIPFLWKAIDVRWGPRAASLAGWIFALYPDYLLFGASQMREPYLITLACIAAWGVVVWRQSWKTSLTIIAVSLTGMGAISSRMVLIVTAVLAIWFWLEYLVDRSRFFRIAGYMALGLAGAALLVLSWGWLRSSAWYDLRLTVLGSGRVQYELSDIQEWLRTPFLVVYGLLQPVLPAIIAYPTLLIWKCIGIFRALGWYLMAPLLIYGGWTASREKDKKERRILFFFTLVVFFWLLISSARGGGDQWDNPRYRLILMPWMVILATRGLQWAFQHRDRWLGRFLLVELIFVGFFTHWYISRYLKWWARLPFKDMVLWIAALSLFVLLSGWLWDLLHKRIRQKRKPEDQPGL